MLGVLGQRTADNKRVPLPLATLAPVKHGPVAHRWRVQYPCLSPDRGRRRYPWLGHVGTLER